MVRLLFFEIVMTLKEINLVYFSPTQTSRKVAEAVAQGIGIEKINVYDATHSEICFNAAGNSLTIVAVPVYGGHMPITARKRIQNIAADRTPVVPIAVYGNRAYEDALKELSGMLEKCGFITVAAATFIGEHSYSTKDNPIAMGRPDRQDFEFAVDFGRKVSQKLSELENPVAGRIDVRKIRKPFQPLFPLLGFIYNVIKLRRSGRPMPQAPVTDKDLCTHCGVCVNSCPVAAIERGREDTTNSSACIRCCACVKRCPHGARHFETPFAELLSRYFSYRKKNTILL